MRNSTVFLLSICFGMGFFSLMLIHSQLRINADRSLLEQEAKLVEKFDLTDLCLCTEATYARHPSQADRYAAFQDHPISLEHFPEGSLIVPPSQVK